MKKMFRALSDENVFVGISSSYEDLYTTLLFLSTLFILGDVFCRRFLKIVPSLVGHIIVGILFGPEGFNVIQYGSTAEHWVLLGNLGLLMLILQAGLEMDIQILKLVGPSGIGIAIIGSILPICIGTGIAFVFLRDHPFLSSSISLWKNVLSAGCSFGPTSAGIAMNVLGQCGVLQKPVGQLIVAAAIIDDILALVVLSQLRALTTKSSSILEIMIPVISAILWLCIGGVLAIFIFPKIHNRLMAYIDDFKCRKCNEHVETNNIKYNLESPVPSPSNPDQKANQNAQISLFFLFLVFLALLPATNFSKASYLMGAFLSGLAFCQDKNGLQELFNHQFKRLIQWLMKIFFAATIGFQVPVRSFANGSVISKGLLFSFALMGKFLVGFLVPNFHHDNYNARPNSGSDSNNNNTAVLTTTTTSSTNIKASKCFKGQHLRDCFVVGFSMMGEAEFAFVVSGFGVSEGLIPPDIYASIVFAILFSAIISPLLLRITLIIYPYKKPREDDIEVS